MSSGGFRNQIINPEGNLVYPQVMSPGFNIANPSASPSPSWAILKNGLAYLFGVILTGGTLTGTDYIINTTGAFFYTGTPALGNLAISIVPGTSSVTDPEGNTARPGVTVYDTAAAGTFLQMLAGTPASLLLGTGDAAEATPGTVLTQITVLSASKHILSTTLRAPRVTGEAAGAFCSLVLSSPYSDLSLPANASIVVSDGTNTASLNVGPTGFTLAGQPVTATAGTPANPTKVTTDTPQTASSLYVNNWSAAAAGTDLMYELMPDNTVQVSGRLVNSTVAGISGASNITTALPAAYRPLRDEPVRMQAHASASPFGATAGSFGLVRSTGVVEFFGTFSTTSTLEVSGRYPLGF